MKTTFIVFLGLLGAFMLHAQNPLIESDSIIGVWRQVHVHTSIDGQNQIFKTGNYKIISPDGTYFTLISRTNKPETKDEKTIIEESVTNLGHYGTYTNLTDSSYTENIIKHGFNPNMSGTTSEIRYKILDENTMLAKYKNRNSRWISAIWHRVVLPENRAAPQVEQSF